jgi:hypothetical protein
LSKQAFMSKFDAFALARCAIPSPQIEPGLRRILYQALNRTVEARFIYGQLRQAAALISLSKRCLYMFERSSVGRSRKRWKWRGRKMSST